MAAPVRGRVNGRRPGPASDPLTDPLTGPLHGRPDVRPPVPEPIPVSEPVPGADHRGGGRRGTGPGHAPEEGHIPERDHIREQGHTGDRGPVPEQAPARLQAPGPEPVTGLDPLVGPESGPGPEYGDAPDRRAVAPDRDDATIGLRTSDTRRALGTPPADSAPSVRTPVSPPPPGPGRAERRRAARGRGRKQPDPATAMASDAPARPLSRIEARRAARAAKDSPAVIASRAIGELFISFGVLMLLFVTYQLWWTNVRAGHEVSKETNKIQDSFEKDERTPGAFEPGQGFAIMYIPKLDVVVPVAEGIDKDKVLDRGMVGHYADGRLKTAMPADRTGNFAVAGHRNTHGEPFRYINRLKPGDPIVVETRDAYYTYEMASILPQTSPSNIGVIGPVPPGSGFTEPGRYITLTTCTPEFTSTYRMIVWGKMVEERPRSKGKPDALIG
ncbi:class E sortase [Streptomyces sp. NPDC004609]|uniref:class E sortase n=1 Tax=Streptomyces sp. NPDC004609 TaxID=3364704 RepID=UPI00369C9A73